MGHFKEQSHELYGGKPPHEQTRTSEAAADSMRANAGTLREKVHAHIASKGESGATDDEIEIALGLTHQTCSARRRELVLLGRLIYSGRERKTRSNRQASVWVAHDGQPVKKLPSDKDPKAIERLLNHAGAIGLLCELSTRIRHGLEKEEDLGSIERCIADFCKITGGHYKRTLDRIEYFP